MLILTRKPGETVVVDDDVRITVLAVRGNQIKLGIEAPQEVRVNRLEVLERDPDWSPNPAESRPAPHEIPHRRHVQGDQGWKPESEGPAKNPRQPEPRQASARPESPKQPAKRRRRRRRRAA